MKPKERSLRQNYADLLHIKFLGPVQPSRWPETHTRLFSDTQKLGCREYDDFVESITIDSLGKPWRNSTKSRADRLASKAEMCFREGKDERGWRMSIEHEVLHRFTLEVACTQCRNKLWDSEIPAAIESNDSFAESLERRRRRRKACQCPQIWGQSQYDGGLNELFSDRAEAAIRHDPALPVKTDQGKFQHHESPDRVYGLIQTDNFKLLLDSMDKRATSSERPLRETIEFSPFNPESEPLLYPFLIMEAKRSDGAGRKTTELQTAFVLRRLLKLQLDLEVATKEETVWHTGPLVWFLTHRGENWYVSAAFTEPIERSETQFTIVDLWTGDIRNKSKALQLLFIIDYIFDWARDIYRPVILGALNALGTGRMMSADPDIFSQRLSAWMRASTVDDEPASQFLTIQEPPALEFLNIVCPEGVVRDASIIESRFLLLEICDTDVDSFLLSFESIDDANAWLHGMLTLLSDSWKVTAETIGSLEEGWTGQLKTPRRYYESNETFHLNIAVHIFMSEEWDLIRQITCLCISESALQNMLANMGCLYEPNFHPNVGSSAIETFLSRILKQSITDYLTASISMFCMTSCTSTQQGMIDLELLVTRSENFFAGFKLDTFPRLIVLVTTIYEKHKIGRREPGDPYIRMSRSQSRHTIKFRGKTPQIWPQLPAVAIGPNQIGPLVDGTSEKKNCPPRCLFTFGQSINIEDIPALLRAVMEDGPYSKTLQVGIDSWNEEKFHHINKPIKINNLWRAKRDNLVFERWIQTIESIVGQKDSQPGDSASSPMIID